MKPTNIVNTHTILSRVKAAADTNRIDPQRLLNRLLSLGAGWSDDGGQTGFAHIWEALEHYAEDLADQDQFSATKICIKEALDIYVREKETSKLREAK